eukprot:TRINITY_DN8670_c0_g1_i1.p1 TRINITY_DN8670_c0_g1~~TRINITY_DN8670_c0_g1_i1.p1  ORF type:complete len:284 (+),score=98.50 TRINITY_DN8670_c0_g1_i1:294-1145(+)
MPVQTPNDEITAVVNDGKNAFGDSFRNYEDSTRQDTVEACYKTMHENQTVEFVEAMHHKWLNFDHGKHTVEQIVEMLDQLVDDSDPDNDLPNSVHDFQTAERIRKAWPEHDWFHLVGLLHDLGKVMALWGEPQWCVVGDTFPVGCQHSDKIVFPHQFEHNPDAANPLYNTAEGMYSAGCGLDSVKMSWGHDEYMYQMLKFNQCTIPEEGLNMIRFHSFYPWHTGLAYEHLCSHHDLAVVKPWVLEFNKFDLYSKGDDVPEVQAVWPYYKQLLVKYNLDGLLNW